jgi:hypothetical protein
MDLFKMEIREMIRGNRMLVMRGHGVAAQRREVASDLSRSRRCGGKKFSQKYRRYKLKEDATLICRPRYG